MFSVAYAPGSGGGGPTGLLRLSLHHRRCLRVSTSGGKASEGSRTAQEEIRALMQDVSDTTSPCVDDGMGSPGDLAIRHEVREDQGDLRATSSALVLAATCRASKETD